MTDDTTAKPDTTASKATCGCAIVAAVYLEDHYGGQRVFTSGGWAEAFEHTKSYLGGALFAGDAVTVHGNGDDGSFRVFDGSEVTNEQHWRTEEIAECNAHEATCTCTCCFDLDGYIAENT